ncbi:MAG: AAA-like domain-containing protein [Pelatocladus maniniholoensis HA4357-MV3]|uniref:AAA-like domain-containing protein n=1 Tax=Pelatocladus maniniholoensis HA4357-MV3 TaxID=1117104 RepID=A0A9E3HEA9_9NOST|nr:AAA-like domain-containing protein [Pelatocladus maniniholoensis HA4357-MV3]
MGQTKTRLLAMGAVIIAGTLVSGAVGGLVAGLAGNILANDLGDLAKRLGEDKDILSDRELSQAVWQAIALVIESVAKKNDYPADKDQKKILKQLPKFAVECGSRRVELDAKAGIEETHLLAIFSSNADEFQTVQVLDKETWKEIINWLCDSNNVHIPELHNYVKLRDHLAETLYIKFPSALREVLKEDAAKGGQAFAAMQLLLLGNITAALKQSNSQNTEIVKQLEELQQTLKKVAVMQIRRLPVPDDFQWIIKDKTDGFVGRVFVFREISQFFYKQSKGYFIIKADPGMGKSSILAEFVRRNDCIVYFNQRNEGITNAEQFLRSICTQLIETYQLNYDKEIRPENTCNSNFLSKLLTEVSAKLKSGEKLVIAVDALDEVDLSSQSPGANVLYLPSILPDKVYFIVTKRPLPPDQLPLQVRDKQLFDLMQYPSDNEKDVETYIRQRINKVADWIKSRGATEEELVSTLVKKSERNFIYLRYVFDDIENGKYSDLKIQDLPSDLQDYYYKHWERMGMNAQPKPLFKIQIVYILSESPQPIPFEEIVEILIANDQQEKELGLRVQEVLDEWSQFLREEEKYQQTFYSLYHSSFRDFLRNEKTVKRAGITLQGIIKMMTQS